LVPRILRRLDEPAMFSPAAPSIEPRAQGRRLPKNVSRLRSIADKTELYLVAISMTLRESTKSDDVATQHGEPK
ncbi:MAG: hypothetical protein KKB37_01470, partial [Alphaproteobacteria bacterium]|nr:hypothetical protein [Alphaproteobacteria bacterium]